MTRLDGSGVTVDLPAGWEGQIGRTGRIRLKGVGEGDQSPALAHFANFPLPPERADFGAEAVAGMRAGDVFVVLFEYGPESASRALFSQEGIPRIAAGDFDRNALQHGIPGQSGLQRFFTVNGRPFCLYVVVGSHLDRADVVPAVNTVLQSLTIS